MKKKYFLISFLAFSGYTGTGLFIGYNEYSILFGQSIFFALSIYFFFFLFSFCNGTKINAIITDTIYGYTDQKMGRSNQYYIEYTFKTKTYRKRLAYSTSSTYQNGDSIQVLVNHLNQVIIYNHFKYFIVINIFVFFLTIFLLFH